MRLRPGHHAVIALGSNVGDRARHLWYGLQQLASHGVQVVRSSNLYETSAAYVTDQPSFLNAAVLTHTTLSPRDLLHQLKSIEQQAGRDVQGGPRWGPRPLDMDIIAFGGQPHNDGVLQIPHPRWRERPFVTAPMADLLYGRDIQAGRINSAEDPCQTDERNVMDILQHAASLHEVASTSGRHADQCTGVSDSSSYGSGSGPSSTSTASSSSSSGNGASAAAAVASTSAAISGGDVLRRVVPLREGVFMERGRRTVIMGILNVTPDSFSDGGMFMHTEQALDQAHVLLANGADILDIGGQSTRPGAERVSTEEELNRVIPVIRALRASGAYEAVVSVDTFDATVAREAVLAGADIVNDVSGGTMDSRMHRQVAELGVPYVCMHMRGDPQTMASPQHTGYGCAWRDIGAALQDAAERAMAAGIPAWNIILDPGIGFAKKLDSNLDILRNLSRLRHEALQGGLRHAPILVGPSRKGFLGKLTGRPAGSDLDAATAAACVAAVAHGADMVRVHDTRGVGDALKIADAVFRSNHAPNLLQATQ